MVRTRRDSVANVFSTNAAKYRASLDDKEQVKYLHAIELDALVKLVSTDSRTPLIQWLQNLGVIVNGKYQLLCLACQPDPDEGCDFEDTFDLPGCEHCRVDLFN